MEIKPGKYRTRDGRQAVVLEVLGGKAFGRSTSKHRGDNFWEEFSWYLDGSYFLDGRTVSNHDLIAPWEEPKPRLRVWRNIDKRSGNFGYLYMTFGDDLPVGYWQELPDLDALFERSEG